MSISDLNFFSSSYEKNEQLLRARAFHVFRLLEKLLKHCSVELLSRYATLQL